MSDNSSKNQSITDKRKMQMRKAADKWDAENLVRYSLAIDKNTAAKMEEAVADKHTKRNRWITSAIKEKLTRDGYLTDDSTSHNQINE